MSTQDDLNRTGRRGELSEKSGLSSVRDDISWSEATVALPSASDSEINGNLYQELVAGWEAWMKWTKH